MKLGSRSTTVLEPGVFVRPENGLVWTEKSLGLPLQNLPAWESNGSLGFVRNLSVFISAPALTGSVARVHLIGIFGIGAESIGAGEPGAILSIGDQDETQLTLIKDRHLVDASSTVPLHRLTGDGASIETVGQCKVGGKSYRVDLVTMDLPSGTSLAPCRFTVLAPATKFALFDVLYEVVPVGTCPFKSRSGGVALSELAAVVRVGDRVTLRRALDQLSVAVAAAEDLDEAKGEALTFIAVVTAATIEMGSRSMHKVQLDAARQLDSLCNPDQIVQATRAIVENITMMLSGNSGTPSGALIDKAIGIINRNFAKDISDVSVADQLGLSTSHFRYLFKEVTGQPFHKYLIGLRLEKARKLLLEAAMPVSDVATAVGFNSLAHFSRAFTQRFSVSPSNLRRTAPCISE